MNKEEFIKKLKKINIELNNETLAKLDEYYNRRRILQNQQIAIIDNIYAKGI